MGLKNIFLISALVLFFTGCSTTPAKRQGQKAPPAAIKLFNAIQSDINSNKKPQALKKIEKLIHDYPETELAQDVRIVRGEIYFKSGKYEPAYDSFISVVKSEISTPREIEALYWAARSLNSLGRWDEASQLLNQGVSRTDVPKPVLAQMYELKSEVHRQLGDKVEMLRYIIKLEEITDDVVKKEQYRARAFTMVETSLDIKQLDFVASQPDFRFLRPQALYSLGVYYIEDHDYSRARDYFLNIVDLFPQSPLVDKSRSYLDQINARRIVDPKTVGVVVPLTGKYAQVGKKTLMGLQLGLGVYGKQKSDLKLAVIDSEGNPDSARRAVERLVTEDHAIAIVGSASSKTALAIASKADELGVPSIDLSQKTGISEVGESVFRNSVTSEMYVRELVRVAMEEFNINRFAIMYPNDPYGVEYANIFWNEVTRRGGQINGAQPYPRNEKDFKGQVQRLVGTFYIDDRMEEYKLRLKEWEKKQKRVSQRNLPPEDILPPLVDFEALFIPDDTVALGQVASMLKYNDVGGIRLLGTNLWNKPSEFFARGQTFAESSLFVDAFTPSENELKKNEFYQEFNRVFGQKPTVFEIQAYDTGKIIRQILDRGADSRASVIGSLRDGKDFPGVFGPLQVGKNREITRHVVAFTGNNGQIQPVLPSRKP
jgi:branched-chain amino acid transport system substrate-binding protein